MARTEKGFQPLLAERKAPDLAKLKYPKLGSPKLDGIRCIIRGGQALSRKLKPLRNVFIQDCLRGLPEGLDGELMVGDTLDERAWNAAQSGITSRDGEPDFTYQIFDHLADDPNEPFSQRFRRASVLVEDYLPAYPWLRLVPHTELPDANAVERLEDHYVCQGYEGLILRSPDGPYKFGRATMKEEYLLKVKRFIDVEAVCAGYVERMHNGNEQERDERGYAKRSHAKAGKVGTDTLGALVCRIGVRDDGTFFVPEVTHNPGRYGPGGYDIVEFEIGTGYTDAERAALWARRHTDLIGSIHTLKFQGLTPDEKKPRFPVWKGERDLDDISEAAE